MVQILYQTRFAETLLNPSLGSLKPGAKSLYSLQTLGFSAATDVAEQLLAIFYLFYFYWGLEQLLLMFRILSSTELNVTTPVHWLSHPQCRCSTGEMTSPRFLFQHGLSPRPTANLLLHSAVRLPAQQKTLSSNLLPANCTWTSSRHREKPVQTSGKHLSQQWELHFSCSANSPCLCFIPLEESQVCVSDTGRWEAADSDPLL